MEETEISAEEYQRWTPLPQALATVSKAMGGSGSAALAMAQRLRAGRLQAAAEVFVDDNRPTICADFPLVPPAHWKPEWTANAASEFWRSAQMTVMLSSDRAYTATYFGLRASPEGLEKALQAVSAQSPTPRKEISPLGRALIEIAAQGPRIATGTLIDIDNAPNKGGRPSADYWIDMSLAIAHRIHLGDFKPKNQADVVDAMQHWLMDHGFTGGLTKTKECAAKVFKLFKE